MMPSPLEERPVEGDETDDTEALRQIDSHMRGSLRSRMAPRGEDYLGGLPLSSPAGEALGGAVVGSAMGGVQDAAQFGYDYSPSRLIERGMETSADAGQQVQDMIRWAITPRGARSSAAFVPAEADPRSYLHGPDSPVPMSQPTASQSVDYTAGLPSADNPEGWRSWLDGAASQPTASQSVDYTAGLPSADNPEGWRSWLYGAAADSSKVPPTVSTKPGEARAIDTHRGSIRVAMGGGPLEEYVPGQSSDIGAPGRGGFMPSARLDESPESLAAVPLGQRPASYFDDLAAKRAIERGAPAGGDLAGTGLTSAEAGHYRGREYVNRGLAQRQMDVEGFRQAGARRAEREREMSFAEKVGAIHAANAKREAEIEAAPIPEEDTPTPDGLRVIHGKKWHREQAQERVNSAMEDARAGAGIGARMTGGELFKPVS